jgi:hypothetical protein
MSNFINNYYASNNIFNRDTQYRGGRVSDIETEIKMYSEKLLKTIYDIEKDCDLVFLSPENIKQASEILVKYGFKKTDNFESVMKPYHTWLRNKYEKILMLVKNEYEKNYTQENFNGPNEFDNYGGAM